MTFLAKIKYFFKTYSLKSYFGNLQTTMFTQDIYMHSARRQKNDPVVVRNLFEPLITCKNRYRLRNIAMGTIRVVSKQLFYKIINDELILKYVQSSKAVCLYMERILISNY